MPGCSPFSIRIGERIHEVFSVLTDGIESNGGSVAGDAAAGTFSIPLPIGGSISGDYEVDGESVRLKVSKKPMIVPCGRIEDEVRKLVRQAKESVEKSDGI